MKRIKIKYIDNEAELINGFIRNNSRCIEQIYSENYAAVEYYIVRNSGKETDAKDIFQEAILAAWINIREGKFEIKDGKTIGGYLFQIAKYKWLDKLKSKAHRSTIRLVTENHSGIETQSNYGEAEESKMKYLESLYSNLDQKCKAILNRFYYEKMSLEEIGKDLNYDPGTVKTLKYRCMEKLRALHHKKKHP